MPVPELCMTTSRDDPFLGALVLEVVAAGRATCRCPGFACLLLPL